MDNGMYKKNDIVTVMIDDVGNDGEGIGKVDGYTLFVKDAVIGDTVQARITKCKKNYGYARVEKVVTPSSFRVEPRCGFHRQCGGCQIQAMSYDRQLTFKNEKVRNNLIRIGGFAGDYIDSIMEPIVGMDEPWHYRNKAQYPVGYDKNGNLVVGFYAGRTHDIIANTDCALGAKENRLILEAVLAYMRENHVTAYRENDGTGLVRHVLIRTGFASEQIMVCLVINGKKLPAEDKLVEKLRGLELVEDKLSDSHVKDGDSQESMPDKRIVSISVSVNEERTNVIMGKEIRTLWGSERIEDSLRILKVADESADAELMMSGKSFEETDEQIAFRISPLSFYQVNPRQTEKLYSLAVDYAGLTRNETVWDLYCGIGTISLFMAKKAKQVYGVEVIPQAIEDAKENAKRNGMDNVKFYVGKAEEVLPAFYEGDGRAGNNDVPKAVSDLRAEMSSNRVDNCKMRHPDVIVVDPPRKGCDEKCLETMLAMKPKRIVYVSCDSATLARDLKILAAGGYELKKFRAVDQFGQTVHVETVVLLSKGEIQSKKIRVDFSLEDMDMSGFQKGATYQEIKDYVKEKTGLSVSSLYIAQIKRKCGLDVGLNYNLSKKENAKVPQCPPEKEKAIKDALKYFGMI